MVALALALEPEKSDPYRELTVSCGKLAGRLLDPFGIFAAPPSSENVCMPRIPGPREAFRQLLTGYESLVDAYLEATWILLFGTSYRLSRVGGDSEIHHSPKGSFRILGGGEQAEVRLYLDGKHKGLVGRRPSGCDDAQLAFTSKSELERYRMHQIAYLLYPRYNLHVVGLDVDDFEMFSELVPRSRENMMHASPEGISGRSALNRGPCPDEAERACAKMLEAGIFPHTGLPNISILLGRVTFFEIYHVDLDQARKQLVSGAYPPLTTAKGLLLLDALQLERSLDGAEIEDLIDSRKSRFAILERLNAQHLTEFYESEIGPDKPITSSYAR